MDIENYRYEGRGLVGVDGTPGWPRLAYESIRAINHLTRPAAVIPAPVLYEVLGELKGVGDLLPQALTQLAAGLEDSLRTLAVYDAQGDPRESVARTVERLEAAAAVAHRLGVLMEQAQGEIADQGYVPAD